MALAVVVVFSLPFLYLAVRAPVLRRLAVRNAARRPRETALVLLGSLLGTAIITASFVVGDTLDASIRRNATTKLGPIDEVVATTGAEEQAALAERLAALDARNDDIDGVLPLTIVRVAASSGSGDDLRAAPNAWVSELDFPAARAFGSGSGDGDLSGIDGATPPPGTAVVVDDLAEVLEVEAGDVVTVYLYGAEVPLTVDRVVPQRGVAGFNLARFRSDSRNVLVAPGTIAGLVPEPPPGAAPPDRLVAVSNRGGVIDGEARTLAVNRAVSAELGGFPPGNTNIKQQVLDDAEEVGGQFTELFGSIGFFSVIAGILLLVNIFVMLAQERKSELGMLRAVGLRRRSLVGSFTFEGWLYALGSAVLGTVVGVGLGRVISGVAAGIFSASGEGLDLRFAVDGASIQTGFATGFLISLVTVVLTSLWIARINVIRAIRDLPEPTTVKPRLRSLIVGVAAAVVGGLVAVRAIGADDPFGALAGPVILLLGVALLLVRLVPRRPLVTVASAVALLWATGAFSILPDAFDDPDIALFVVQGVILTAAAVCLVSVNQDAIGGAVRRLSPGRAGSVTLRLGLAYPLARRFRTGMILAMYAIVVFTLTFITLFSHLLGSQIEQFTADVAGGFDVTMSSNSANPVPPEAVRAREDVEAVAALSDVDAQFAARIVEGGGYEDWFVTGIDDVFVDRGPTALDDLGPYESADAAYRDVLADPSKTIVSEFFLQQGAGPPEASMEPGERVILRDPLSGRERELTIAAIAQGSFGNAGAYISRASLEELYGPRVAANRLFVALADGVDPDEVAEDLNAEHLRNGADAESFRHLVAENLSFQTQFFRLMQGYLAIGLLVGIAGLGVVMVRAVRERRRQVGVLRALGYQPWAVRRAFLLESGFVALEGIAIGTVLAIITAWQIVGVGTFGEGLSFSVPWLQLAVLVVVTFVASLVATVAPAQQAARIRPAVALRMTD